MFSKIGAVLLLTCSLCNGSGKDLSPKELLYILNIQTWRVRVPASDAYTWTFKVIPKELRKPMNPRPFNLSKGANYLLALRGIRENKFDFVLPGPSGTSRGVLDLCEEGLSCEYYSYSWLDKPECSADGDQCVLAQFTVGFGNEPTQYLVLVQARSRPYEK
jgi:hypothetical protein